MFLFFDASMAGNPKSWKAPTTDTFNWPRMIHLSWLLYNKDRELIDSSDDIIAPEGFEITSEIEQRSQISPDQAKEDGVPVKEALTRFLAALDKAEYVIAHNMKYHEAVLTSELIRKSLPYRDLANAEKYCLMQEATWFCKLPAKGGRFKWPSLQEIHTKLFQTRFSNAGNALGDVSASTVCFFGLLDLDAIELF